MKRCISIILVLLLCVLMLPGCKQPTPSTPGSTPQAVLPPTTPATTVPTGPVVPDGMVLVYIVTGYACEGSEAAFVYDEAGRLLEVTAGADVVVAYTYDAQGNCLSYKNTLDGIDQTYDAQGNILTDRTEDGSITNTYDDAGRCISVECHSADGTLLSITRYTYDDRGNLLSEVFEVDGAMDHEIRHTYDADGNHLTATYCRDGVISAEGPSYVWEYATLVTLESEHISYMQSEHIYYGDTFFQGTLFYYIERADQTLAYMQWDSSGRMVQYSHFFDIEGNLTRCYESIQDADGNRYSRRVDYEFDAHGNTIMHQEVDHLGQEHIFRWTYDETGLLMTGYSLTSPNESYEYAWIFDSNGHKVQEIRTGDAPHEIIWEYNKQGKLVWEARSGSDAYQITYIYDEFGNLIQRRYADSVTTVSNYTYTAFTVTPEVAEQLLAQQRIIFQHLNG